MQDEPLPKEVTMDGVLEVVLWEGVFCDQWDVVSTESTDLTAWLKSYLGKRVVITISLVDDDPTLIINSD